MTNLDTVRVAMIGAGAMANRVHYPSLSSFDDVEIVGISDLDEGRLNATADKYGVERRFLDYRRMIETVAPDAVYAVGPPHVFYDIWVWCLQHSLNLCIEKPMGLTLHHARSLATLATEYGCITQVSFQRRACPLAVMLRERVLQRGRITHAVCRFYKCQPTPYYDAYGHMMGDGVHALDTLRWMCGGNVVDVQSVSDRRGVHDLNVHLALIRFDSGATGVLLNNWSSGRRIFDIEMHAPGICAEAELEVEGRLYVDGDTVGERFLSEDAAGGEDLHEYGGFKAKNRQFIDAVRNKTLPPSHFGDAVKTMRLCDAILGKALLEGDYSV